MSSNLYNLVCRLFLLFFLCVPLLCIAQEERQSVLFLKDGSIIKCEIVEDDEYKIRIATLQKDTIEYSYKYIQSISGSYIPDSFENAERINQVSPKYQKTTGWFANMDIMPGYISDGNTPSFDSHFIGNIAIGKRLNPSLNLGAQLSALRISQYGLATYLKYYLTKNQFSSKLYAEGYIGMSYNNNEKLDYDYAPYGGLNFGIQLASRRAIRFFFEAGVIFLREMEDIIIRDIDTVVVSQVDWYMPFTITFLGIEF